MAYTFRCNENVNGLFIMRCDQRLVSSIVLLCALAGTGGCATVVTGTSQTINVTTEPSAAACQLARRGASLGIVNPTPGSLKVEKSSDDIDITCRKKGYLDASARLPSTFQGWTLGNIVIGGVIGVAIDASSGAMHEYQGSFQMNLSPEQFASVAQRDAFFDAWRADVAREAEKTSQEIAKTCSGAQCEDLVRQAEGQVEVALAEIELSRARAKLAQASEQAAKSQKATQAQQHTAATAAPHRRSSNLGTNGSTR
jgi:hypothetical protein